MNWASMMLIKRLSQLNCSCSGYGSFHIVQCSARICSLARWAASSLFLWAEECRRSIEFDWALLASLTRIQMLGIFILFLSREDETRLWEEEEEKDHRDQWELIKSETELFRRLIHEQSELLFNLCSKSHSSMSVCIPIHSATRTERFYTILCISLIHCHCARLIVDVWKTLYVSNCCCSLAWEFKCLTSLSLSVMSFNCQPYDTSKEEAKQQGEHSTVAEQQQHQHV